MPEKRKANKQKHLSNKKKVNPRKGKNRSNGEWKTIQDKKKRNLKIG